MRMSGGRHACWPGLFLDKDDGRQALQKVQTLTCHAIPGTRCARRLGFRFRFRPWPRPAQPLRRSALGCPPGWTGAPRAPRSARRAPAARCGCRPPPHARAPTPRSVKSHASTDDQCSTAQGIVTPKMPLTWQFCDRGKAHSLADPRQGSGSFLDARHSNEGTQVPLGDAGRSARLVALCGGGQAVRDAQRRAAALQRLQRRHDGALRAAVQRAGCLVQQLDLGRLRSASGLGSWSCMVERSGRMSSALVASSSSRTLGAYAARARDGPTAKHVGGMCLHMLPVSLALVPCACPTRLPHAPISFLFP